MIIYKKTNKIKVLSFDLDDTLYDNKPIIKAALEAQSQYLNRIDNWRQQDNNFWQICRHHVIQSQPDIYYDVSKLRLEALKWGLEKLGLSTADINHYAHGAFQAFMEARSQVNVAPQVLSMLDSLSKKYHLIAITNGNVDISKFSLNKRFELLLMAGPDGLQKPASDMFTQAANTLNLPLSNILHIGDNLDSDVQGANNAGCHSCWLNEFAQKTQYQGLPNIEITNIMELEHFL